MAINAKTMSKAKKDKKTVTIDVTNVYDTIKALAENDIRTFDEEVRYLLRKGIDSVGNITATITHGYVTYPEDSWIRSSPKPTIIDLTKTDGSDWSSNCASTKRDGTVEYSHKMQPINETVVDLKQTADGSYTAEC